jgi:hypothetical protein
MLNLVQFVVTSIGHLKFVSHFNLDTLTMDWTSSMGPRNPTNFELKNLLVPLIILSYNHQNHNYGLIGHVSYKMVVVGAVVAAAKFLSW